MIRDLIPQSSLAIMTWVLGWPLTVEYVKEYAEALDLIPEEISLSDSKLDLEWRAMSSAMMNIRRRCAIPYLLAKACWVDGVLTPVFELAIDYEAKGPDDAEIDRPIPMERAEELGWLLGATEEAKWYKYHDGHDCESDDDESPVSMPK